MAKFRQSPITAADLKKNLDAADDFAFELRCRHSLSKRPISIEHGGTYSDPVTNKTRQFDIRANIVVEQLRASLAIECKNLSPASPIVVSRIPRVKGEAFHNLLIQEEAPPTRFGISLPRMNSCKSVKIGAPKSIYEEGAFVGKSVARVGMSASNPAEFISDDTEIFDRWSQAVASAYGLISAASSYFWEDEIEPCAYWIVPILVVPKGTLWVADYGADGILLQAPSIADEVEIFLDHEHWKTGQTFSYPISHLHFATPEGMLKLVDRILTNAHFRKRILPPAQAQELDRAPRDGDS